MKKYIIASVLGLFCLIGVAQAQNFTFTRDLKLGASGADVAALQDHLIQNGYSIPSIVSGFVPKGYFGQQTAAAVQRYQVANGIPSTGYVGPMTRAKLNSGSQGNSLTVISPNGGETLVKNTNYSITWNVPSPSYGQAQIGDMWLEALVPPCAEPPVGNPRCLIATYPPRLLAKNINLATRSYVWYVGSTAETTGPNQGALAPIYDGQYKIKICQSGTNNCDSSNAYFQITSASTANAPVINGLDAPTSLTVGQSGTWTVRATDPLNRSLSYSVDWGEPSGQCPPGTQGVCAPLAYVTTQQTSSFTHSYSMAGTYTVNFTVTNAIGQTARTSSTVSVTSGSQVGSLKVINPMKNDILYRNTPYVISWNSPAYFRATYADIQLLRGYQCQSGEPCIAIAYAPLTIAANIPINQNSYTWNVGSVLDYLGQTQSSQDGSYTIQICETGTSNCASSGKFTITAQNSNVPDINVISPNGGESWLSGSTQTVTVRFSGEVSKIGNLVTLSLVDSQNRMTSLGEFSRQTSGNQNYVVNIGTAIPSGQYRLYAALYETGVTCQAIGCPPVPRTMQAYDYSDNTFTINPPYYYPYPQSYPQYDIACPAGYVCSPTY
jgi:hypothetical protein